MVFEWGWQSWQSALNNLSHSKLKLTLCDFSIKELACMSNNLYLSMQAQKFTIWKVEKETETVDPKCILTLLPSHNRMSPQEKAQELAEGGWWCLGQKYGAVVDLG